MTTNLKDERNWTYVKEWLEYPRPFIDKIQSNHLNYYNRMKLRVLEYARSCSASDRLTDLEALGLSGDESRSTYRLIANGCVTALGAFFYARASLLVFVSLGDLAYPASILVGIGFSFILDQLITRILANRLYSQYCNDLSADLKLQSSRSVDSEASNLLKKEYLNECFSFINRVENPHTIKRFSIELMFAVLLNIIEYISTIAIINNVLGDLVEIPFPLLIVLGFLPVILSWAAGVVKAREFEVFELYKKPISRYYKAMTFPKVAEFKKWLEEQEIMDVKLNAAIQVLFNNQISNIDDEKPTPHSAECLFDMEYYANKIQRYEKEKSDEINEIKEAFINEELEIDRKWATEIERRKAGKTKEIDDIFRKIHENNSRKVQIDLLKQLRDTLENQDPEVVKEDIVQECNDLRDKAKQDLKKKSDYEEQQIKSQYDPIIAFHENKKKQAESEYRNELSGYADDITIQTMIEELYSKFRGNWPQ